MWQWDIFFGDLVPRVWGPFAGPSEFRLLKGLPSRRPKAREAGPPECYGRARTASRRPPQSGARGLPRSPLAGAAPDRGGAPAGGQGVRIVAVRWTRRRVRGGGRVAGEGHAIRARWGNQGGAEYGAPAPPVGLSRGPPWRSHPGGVARGAAPRKASGGPCQYTGVDKGGVGGRRTGRPFTTGRHRAPFASRVESPPPSVPH